MLKFKKVTMRNFMSYEQAEVTLDNRGLILIEGINETNETFKNNGAGKTTIAEAITYAIYGTTLRGGRADSVVNRKVGKNTAVILEMEQDDVPFRIERYRKDSQFKNLVKLYKGEEDLTTQSNKETEKVINQLVGIDFPTFVNSIMYGQGDLPMFTTATDKGKKEILENVTGIAIYQKAQAIAKEKLKAVKQELDSVDAKKELILGKLTIIENQEREQLESYSKVASQIDTYKKKLSDIQLEKEMAKRDMQGALDQYNTIIELNKEKQRELQLTIQGLQQEIQATELSKSQVPYPENPNGEREREVAEFAKKVDQLVRVVMRKEELCTSLAKQIDSFDLTDTCPTCGGPMDIEHKKKHLEELKVQLSTTQQERDTLAPKVEALSTHLEEQQGTLVNFSTLLSEYNYKLQEYDMEISKLTQQVVQTETKINQLGYEIKDSELGKVNLTKGITDLEHSESLVLDSLESLESIPKPKPLEAERKAVEDEVEALESTVEPNRKQAEQLEQCVAMFSNTGLRSVVLDMVTPYLNTQANNYLSKLSGGTLEVEFVTQVQNKDGSYADKFDIIITNNGEISDYGDNSGGERRRIDLAISFAIQDLVQSKSDLKTNIAIYDECFDGLDEVGSENVVELLRERQKDVGTIFVITHNDKLKPLFEEVMTVKKENGISKII